jgi:uncharacterized membrane protein
VFAAAIASLKSRVDAVFATAMWGAIAGLAGLVSFGFLVAALFIWIKDAYDPMTASFVFAVFFALIALIAVLMIVILKRRGQRKASEKIHQMTENAVNAGLGVGDKLRDVPGKYLMFGAFAAGLLASLARKRR